MFCSSCGRPVAGQRFCGSCGQGSAASTRQVAAAAPPPPPPPPPMIPRTVPAGHTSPGVTGARSWSTPTAPWMPPTAPPLPYASRPAAGGPSLASVVLPIREWLDSRFWRRGGPALFLVAAISPFVLLMLSADLKGAVTGFACYFALLWFVGLRWLLQPDGVRPWAVVLTVGATVLAGIPLAVALETHLVAGDDPGALALILGVGLPEELVKALPVLAIAWFARGRLGTRAGMFLGAVSGLAFGVVEAIGYSLWYADSGDTTVAVALTLWRLVSGSVFHATMAGIVGYFVALACDRPSRGPGWAALGLGLLGTAALHGCYDWTSDGWLGTLTAAAVVLAFLGYSQVAGDSPPAAMARTGSAWDARPRPWIPVPPSTLPVGAPAGAPGPTGGRPGSPVPGWSSVASPAAPVGSNADLGRPLAGWSPADMANHRIPAGRP